VEDQPDFVVSLTAAMLVGLTRLISGAQARWQGCQPEMKQRIYFANHSSHLDFTLLWSALPPAIRARTRPVAARDYWQGSSLKRFLAERVFRTVLIDRAMPAAAGGALPEAGAQEGQIAKAAAAIGQIAEAMRGGDSIVLFPEGTRGRDGVIGPFKSGLYHLCRLMPGVEAVPVYLENLNRILPKGEILPVPLMGGITFGAPLTLQSGESKQGFLDRSRQALLALRNP
jgi:1-acyl-sn-glycerol-3-phosphate acyltransferase